MRTCVYNILCTSHVYVHFSHDTLQDDRLWFSSAVVRHPKNNLSDTVNNDTAFDNGYKTVLHKYDNTRWHLRCFRSQCTRNRARNSELKTQSKRTSDKSELCNFYLPVHYCTDRHLFFVRKNGGCNFTHNGHFFQDREIMLMGIKQIPADIRRDTEAMLAEHVPTAVVAQVVKLRCRYYMTPHALKHLRRVVFSEKYSDALTAAEKTLQLLRQDKSCNYSYILGSMDHAKSLITIRKGSWKLRKTAPASVEPEEQHEETMSLTDEDERTRYTYSLLEGLSVGKKTSYSLLFHS